VAVAGKNQALGVVTMITTLTNSVVGCVTIATEPLAILTMTLVV
jgi:hypothetical protein